MTDWAVGMIAATRATATLERSLASLSNAGFGERVTVCWDGTRAGSWVNWLRCAEALLAQGRAVDAYLIVEDDAVYCRGLRAYMESHLWPNTQVGILSPYLPGPYKQEAGWHPHANGWRTVGSLCLALRPAFLASVVEHADEISEYGPVSRRGITIDGRLGQYAEDYGWEIWYHRPSLVQHIAPANSARVTECADSPLRVAQDFVGEGTVWPIK